MSEKPRNWSENLDDTLDDNVQRMNTAVGAALGEMVRTTIGPRGMDKLLVDSDGMVLVTNDGATILGELDIELDVIPAGRLIIELATEQNETIGDGATTTVLLAGELLSKADDLLNRGVHPTTIARGYHLAAEKFRETVATSATTITVDDIETIEQIAQVAISGTGSSINDRILAERVIDAVQVLTSNGTICIEDLLVRKVVGGTIGNSTIIKGFLLDQEPIHVNMPKQLEPARIVCLQADLKVKETKSDLGELVVRTATEHHEFRKYENGSLLAMVHAIEDSGANVVFTTEGIDEKAQRWLADRGILAVQRVSTSDLKLVSRATDAMVATDIESIETSDLGTAALVEQRDYGGDNMLVVKTGEESTHVTLVLRGGPEQVLDEMERAARNGLASVRAVYRDTRIVPGGGALEVESALTLREYADSLNGQEQLVARAFAEALQIVPRTLAENTGLDPLDTLIELRRQHSMGKSNSGVDAVFGQIRNMTEAEVIEPALVKEQLVVNTVEVVNRILTIDDILTARDSDDFN